MRSVELAALVLVVAWYGEAELAAPPPLDDATMFTGKENGWCV
jgi:hypothetical protein